MTHWSDDYTDEQIQEMKDNEKPFGLCEDWMQDAFKRMDNSELDHYLSSWSEHIYSSLTNPSVYRLRLGWERPEKELKKAAPCSVETTDMMYRFEKEEKQHHFAYGDSCSAQGGLPEEKKFKVVEYDELCFNNESPQLIQVKINIKKAHGGGYEKWIKWGEASSYQGFIGYRFKETGDLIHDIPVLLIEKNGLTYSTVNEAQIERLDLIPATPKSVVFMEEE